jgi:hypothetical protein
MSTEHKRSHRESGDKSQLRAFRKAAREAGCDDNEERFQGALRTVAKAKPSKEKPNKHDGAEKRSNDKG